MFEGRFFVLFLTVRCNFGVDGLLREILDVSELRRPGRAEHVDKMAPYAREYVLLVDDWVAMVSEENLWSLCNDLLCTGCPMILACYARVRVLHRASMRTCWKIPCTREASCARMSPAF